MRSKPIYQEHVIAFLCVVASLVSFSVASSEELPKPAEDYLPSALVSIAFTPDGKQIVGAGPDGTLTLWQVEGGINLVRSFVSLPPPKNPLERVLSSANGYLTLSIASTGTFFATAGNSGLIEVWKLEGNTPHTILSGHMGKVTTVSISGDGLSLASAGDDGTIRLWNIEDGVQTEILHKFSCPALCVTWSANGKLLAATNANQDVIVWDTATKEVQLNFTAPPTAPKANGGCLVFNPRSTVITAGYICEQSSAGCLNAHYLKAPPDYTESTKGKSLSHSLNLERSGSGIRSAMHISQGDELITLLADNSVVLWNTEEWKITHSWNLAEHLPNHLQLVAALSPTGQLGIGGAVIKSVMDSNSGKNVGVPEASLIMINLAPKD